MKRTLLAAFLLSACARTPSTFRHAASTPVIAAGATGNPEEHQAHGQKYAIAAQGSDAAAAGARMFEEGGNIIDAAVAVSFGISVERPQSTGLGGGGFLLYREAKTGKVYALDFRERAPLKAARDMFLDTQGNVVPGLSVNGILSVATPGLVAGLLEAHRRWGHLPLARVLAPAIATAENGLVVSHHLAAALAVRQSVLAQDPAAAKIFLKPDGSPYKEGERIVQKDLAKTLRLIAARGRAGFYEGPVAKAILATSRRLRGLLTRRDLRAYRVKMREPVRGTFRGLELYSMPPPSSGGIHVLQILNILENDPLAELGLLSAESIHRTASAMQLAFADRAVYPGDPDFVKVPTGWLVSKSYARARRALILPDRARRAEEVRAGKLPQAESPETTHFSIMDAAGNAVSSTQTINASFGSGIVADGTGVVLNDQMDDFSAKPGAANIYGAIGGDANAIAPGKTPLSSMSPTIVVRDGMPVMAVGAPGGTRIINCVAQTILNYFVYHLSPLEAVSTVRMHQQWMPDRLDLESPGPGAEAEARLREMGHQVNVSPESIFCRVELVVRNGARLTGVSDPRDAGRGLAQ